VDGCRILCYHGSPGTAADFDEVGLRLGDGFETVPVARRQYPPPGRVVHTEGAALPADGAPWVAMGYSWGCVACLRDVAAAPDRARAVVLVAPYLGGGKVGLVKRFLLSTRFPGHLLVGLSAGNIVRELLEKSSRPKAVPAAYQALAPQLARAAVLARAGLEKADPGMPAEEACRLVREAGVPVLLVWGRQDANEGSQQYAEQVVEWLQPNETVAVEDGGHALLWTHAAEVAEAVACFLKRTDV